MAIRHSLSPCSKLRLPIMVLVVGLTLLLMDPVLCDGHDHGDDHDHPHDHDPDQPHDHDHDHPHDHDPDQPHDHDHPHDPENTSSLPYHEHVHKHENHSTSFNVTLEDVAQEESLFFVKKLFDKYGDESTLSRSHLLVLLKEIGMDVDKMKGEELSHVVTRSVTDVQHVHSSHDEENPKPMETNLKNNGCGTINEMLAAFHFTSSHVLTPREFAYLCPAIVYHLDQEHCRSQVTDHNHDGHHDHDHDHDHGHSHHHHHAHDHDEHHDEEEAEIRSIGFSNIPKKVWGFSCVAVLIISLVGLLGVAVIPIMQKVFYNHLLQFLVALAIGALSGDALLHLLPHAIMADGHGHNHGEAHGESEAEEERLHRSAALKGLIAFLGILFFFIAERLLTIITAIKRNKKSEKQTKKKRCAKYCDVESNKKSMKAKLSHRQLSDDGCDKFVMVVHPNKALRGLADVAHDEAMHQCDDDVSPDGLQSSPLSLTSQAKGDHNGVHYHHHHHNHHQNKVVDSSFCRENDEEDEKDAETPIFRGFDQAGDGADDIVAVSSGHSHGHGHAHAHSVPTSVAAVAWMVILGDGIHNFSDGLAIGAAFANSITGGFSTSIAVFCHELPHEIGDFAVLLRAGMSVKQAIMYNCLSSILCFMGMLIGVSLGNITSATEWIFACVGGMFLYIALVDMLPEMTSVDPKKGESPYLHLFLQVVGILIGSFIMLIIAIFEHDIKQTFD